MKKKYLYTNQKDLRRAFWQFCDDCQVDYTDKKTKFDTTLSCMFNDWIDGLMKDGAISHQLWFNASLY